jgi:hypothetical protein
MVGQPINKGIHGEVMYVSINVNIIYQSAGVVAISCRKFHRTKKIK